MAFTLITEAEKYLKVSLGVWAMYKVSNSVLNNLQYTMHIRENKFIHGFHKMAAPIRLLLSAAFASIAFFVTRQETLSVQFMSVWISFAGMSLILFWTTIITAHSDEIRQIARKQDSSRTFIFFVVIIASFISLFAVVLLMRILPSAKEPGYYSHLALSFGSVISSWILIHTIFTFRYAHLFYTNKSEDDGIQKNHVGGLVFLDDPEPDYLDFAYFAFVLGMTFQVSDVQVSSSHIRRLALLHGLLSFAFNTIILALSINIVSGLIQR